MLIVAIEHVDLHDAEFNLGLKRLLLLERKSGIVRDSKGLGVGAGDEVIVPGFTCVVVTQAVRFTGA